MRFEVIGAGRWHMAINDGVVTMTESSTPVDDMLQREEETLRRLGRGQLKRLIAFMQGLMTIPGAGERRCIRPGKLDEMTYS